MTGAYELDPLTGDLRDFSIPLKAVSCFLPLTVSKEGLKNDKQTKEHFPKANVHAGEGVCYGTSSGYVSKVLKVPEGIGVT